MVLYLMCDNSADSSTQMPNLTADNRHFDRMLKMDLLLMLGLFWLGYFQAHRLSPNRSMIVLVLLQLNRKLVDATVAAVAVSFSLEFEF